MPPLPSSDTPLDGARRAATECALHSCRSAVGLYRGLELTLGEFRARPARELVAACERDCPVAPGSYGSCLLAFREELRARLKDRGYPRPRIMLGYLCAVWEETGPDPQWSWGDWCDYLAQSL